MNKEKIIATTCPYCGVGCGIQATVGSNGTVSVKGNPNHPANFGRLCSKGSAVADTTGLDGRALYPSVHGQRVSWDEAIDTVARSLNTVIAEHGPDAVGFYVSGQLLTEDYYVANKLMKGFIGSANIDTNSRLCMSSAVAGYKRAFGGDTVPVCYDDLNLANLIVIVGSNTAWCHPIVFQRIVQAKQDNPDLRIVVIDPRQTATCDIADLHLPLKPGSDASLFNGLLHYLAQHHHLDQNFIDQHTEGLTDALQAARHTAARTESLAHICELPQQDIEQFFRLFAETERVITLYSQGVNQSSSGTDKSNSIINCHLATGRIGKPGTGPFSITGQPNAMGGREVGALSNQLTCHMDLDNPAHLALVSQFWNTDRLATHPGLKAVDLFKAVDSGQIKAIWIMATNPVVTLPDADTVRQAIERCDLVIVSETNLNTGTAARASIVLPALAWGEKSGTVTNSERRISRQRCFLPAPGEAKDDWWIISQVAQKMGFKEAFNYQCAADIFREYAALSGYDNNGTRAFDISGLSQISNVDYDQLEPIQWPVNTAHPDGTARLFENQQFFTPNHKAQFIPITPRLPACAPSEDYPLVLNTGRIRDQWHTMTRTARSPRLNTHIAEPFVQIHPEDAQRYHVSDGALADIASPRGNILVRVMVSDRQRPGSLFVPMHWNDFLAARARVNALVNPVVDPISGQPESKHSPARIQPAPMAWYGFILTAQPLDVSFCQYWVKIKTHFGWRYELADTQALTDPERWIRDLCGAGGEWISYTDAARNDFRAAKINDQRLTEVFFMSAKPNLPNRTWLEQVFEDTALDEATRASILAAHPGGEQEDIGAIVCACFGVGENTIKAAINAGKACTVAEIGQQLKAGTNCGSCLPEIKSLLETVQQAAK